MELLTGTLPTVWIPTTELRDTRSLMRTRLAMRSQCTAVKNRIRAALNRYNVKKPDDDGDLFEGRGRIRLHRYIDALPQDTRESVPQVGFHRGGQLHRRKPAKTHPMQLFERLKASEGHGTAAVAVDRQLAEASWWVLKKREPCREPN